MTNLTKKSRFEYAGNGYDSFLWKNLEGEYKILIPGLETLPEEVEVKQTYKSLSGLSGSGIISVKQGLLKKVGYHRSKNGRVIESKSNGAFLQFYDSRRCENFSAFMFVPQGTHEISSGHIIVTISSSERLNDYVYVIDQSKLNTFMKDLENRDLDLGEGKLIETQFYYRDPETGSINPNPETHKTWVNYEYSYTTRVYGIDFQRFTRMNYVAEKNPLHNWKWNRKRSNYEELEPIEQIVNFVISKNHNLILEENQLYKSNKWGVLTEKLDLIKEINERVKEHEVNEKKIFVFNDSAQNTVFIHYSEEMNQIYEYEYSEEQFFISNFQKLLENAKTNIRLKIQSDLMVLADKEKAEEIDKDIEGGKWDDLRLTAKDSYNVGNCRYGTEEFIKQFNIDLGKGFVTLGELRANPKWEEMKRNTQFQRVFMHLILK